VHGIVASHGGAVTVASAPGQGTTFEVYLPRIKAVVHDEAPLARSLPAGTGRILFVDDEEALAFLGQELLRHFGYEVMAYTRSMEALEAFWAAPQRFALVITDQTMPQMTGEVLAQELRRIRPDIPIILCTGFSYGMHAERARALGIDALLMKPIGPQDLARAVAQVMAQRRA
jgi:CheY-like chemotaxis protein